MKIDNSMKFFVGNTSATKILLGSTLVWPLIVSERNKIIYTSTDGNIVTPYTTDVFGANIISNEYKDGIGVITFDGDVTTIGDDAFIGLVESFAKQTDSYRLTSVTIPDSVTTIGRWAFGNCDNLTHVTIPNSVTTLGDYAFAACDSLTSVTIGDSVTTIGNYAFQYCDLTHVTIPNSVTTLRDDAFSYCNSLTSVTIGNSVTTMGSAFSYCNSLTSVTISDGVTTIGGSAFQGCESLTSVNIPDSVTEIGGGAFYHCYSLPSVTIPDSVTTIGNYAFQYCYSLKSVYCKATTPPVLGWSTVFDNNGVGRKIYVPTESVEAYKSAEYWSEYANAIVGYDFNQ